MDKQPLISVVMSVYNGGRFYLSKAIGSILLQTYRNFEFIIVDDCSDDITPYILQGYSGDTRLRILRNDRNMGLTKSLNKAIGQARGEIIARQDADDISLPKRFEKQVEYLETHPWVVLLGTSAFYINDSGRIIGCLVVYTKPKAHLKRENQFVHGSTMFRRKAFEEVGGYDERYRFSQDYELWLRMSAKYEIANLRDALYKLRFHQNTVSLRNLNQSAYYHVMARGTKQSGDVKFLTHTIAGNMLVRSRRNREARAEYREALKLRKSDYLTLLNIALSYLGLVHYGSHKFYRFVKNLYRRMCNTKDAVNTNKLADALERVKGIAFDIFIIAILPLILLLGLIHFVWWLVGNRYGLISTIMETMRHEKPSN